MQSRYGAAAEDAESDAIAYASWKWECGSKVYEKGYLRVRLRGREGEKVRACYAGCSELVPRRSTSQGQVVQVPYADVTYNTPRSDKDLNLVLRRAVVRFKEATWRCTGTWLNIRDRSHEASLIEGTSTALSTSCGTNCIDCLLSRQTVVSRNETFNTALPWRECDIFDHSCSPRLILGFSLSNSQLSPP